MTSTPHNPDERDLLDFADAVNAGQSPQPTSDLERTYLHIQNAMQGESAAIPSTTKQSTWEDVMSTLAIAPEAPVSNRTRKRRALSSPSFTPKRMQWSPLASIAAALLVIIASFGLWQMLGTGNGSSLEPPRDAPQLAALVPIEASPEAIVVYDDASCPDMSETARVLVMDTPSRPDGSASDTAEAWLEDNGDVMVRCPNGSEIVLAEGMDYLNTTNDPQIVIYSQTGDRRATQTYHHLVLGKTLDDNWGLKPTFSTNGTGTGTLRVVVSTEDPSQWSIANFQTMEESTLSDLSDQWIYSGQSITAIGSSDQQTMAIAVSMYESEGSAILLRASGAPGDVVVINADFSEVHWVSIPESMETVNNIKLSDDGTEITFVSGPSPVNGLTEEKTVTVNIATGEISDN